MQAETYTNAPLLSKHLQCCSFYFINTFIFKYKTSKSKFVILAVFLFPSPFLGTLGSPQIFGTMSLEELCVAARPPKPSWEFSGMEPYIWGCFPKRNAFLALRKTPSDLSGPVLRVCVCVLLH